MDHDSYIITSFLPIIMMFSDLAEVMSVTVAAPARGPPKKTDDRSFIDVRNPRVNYCTCHWTIF
jgi:hypothetical protein